MATVKPNADRKFLHHVCSLALMRKPYFCGHLWCLLECFSRHFSLWESAQICVINDPLSPSLNFISLISFVHPLVSPDTFHQFAGSLLNFPWHFHPVIRISCVSFKSLFTVGSFTAQGNFILTSIMWYLCLEITQRDHEWSLPVTGIATRLGCL